MNNFDRFCSDNEIKAWKEAFYHHCMSKGYTNIAVEDLKKEWSEFLTYILAKMS